MSQTVFITGASSGLGLATAQLFQAQGWNVVATMRTPEQGTALSALPNTLVLPLDVTDPASIAAAVQTALARFGTIEVLVNNAGYALIGAFEGATLAQIQAQYAVNVFGLMQMTQAVLPGMRQARRGTIVNISSFGGITAGEFSSLYNSSKFAVEGFSEGLSHELAFLGIAVKLVEPGSIATQFRQNMQLAANTIPDYAPRLGTLVSRYSQRTGHLTKASAEEVARTVYEAATDQQPRLRYVVGEDAAYYIQLKQQHSEAEFLQLMRD